MGESGSDSLNELPLNGEAPLPESETSNGNGISSPEFGAHQESTEMKQSSISESVDVEKTETQRKAPENSFSSSSSPTFSEAEPAADIDGVAVETHKPKKRGKNYPPPMLPSSLPPRLIPVKDVYSSDDEELPHSNIPLSQRRKNGYCTPKSSSLRRKKTAAALKRSTKNDRDILNDIDNPKPSTSAALVREMTRILSAAKDGAISNGTARSRESLSSSSHSVDKSVTPKSVQKRPAPTRKLPLSQSSAKKKLNVASQKSSDEAQARSDAEVFDNASEKEATEARAEAPTKKRAKRSAQLFGSTDDENKKVGGGGVKPKVTGNGASVRISRSGKRKTDQSNDAETGIHRGPNKKPRGSDPALENEPNAKPKHSTANKGKAKSPLNAAASSESVNESGVSLQVTGPVEPEEKPKRRGRKPNNYRTRKPAAVARVADDKESEESVLAQAEATATVELAASSEPASAPINTPVITIVSASVPPTRKSVRERRPRIWIY